MDTFNLKKFLVENKLTKISQLTEEESGEDSSLYTAYTIFAGQTYDIVDTQKLKASSVEDALLSYVAQEHSEEYDALDTAPVAYSIKKQDKISPGSRKKKMRIVKVGEELASTASEDGFGDATLFVAVSPDSAFSSSSFTPGPTGAWPKETYNNFMRTIDKAYTDDYKARRKK